MDFAYLHDHPVLVGAGGSWDSLLLSTYKLDKKWKRMEAAYFYWVLGTFFVGFSINNISNCDVKFILIISSSFALILLAGVC